MSGVYEIIGVFFPRPNGNAVLFHWYRNAFTMCPWKHLREVVAMLKAIHAQEDKAAARQKAALVAEKLRTMKLERIASFVENSVEERLSYNGLPYEHLEPVCGQITVLERIMKEIRRRTRLSAAFRMDTRAMMLVGARLRHISTTKWGTRLYEHLQTLRRRYNL